MTRTGSVAQRLHGLGDARLEPGELVVIHPAAALEQDLEGLEPRPQGRLNEGIVGCLMRR